MNILKSLLHSRTFRNCAIVAFAGMSACTAGKLIPLNKNLVAMLQYVDIDAQFCTSPRAVAKQKIKYLFILDHSASNQPGFPNPLNPTDVTSSDPTGARRYGPLIQFVNNLVPDPNNLTSFALIDFEDTAYQPNDASGNPLTGFTSNPATFVANATHDWIGIGTALAPNPIDQGFTDYKAALQLAFNVIQADARSESFTAGTPIVTVTYQIVFVSDGIPTVITAPGSPTPTYTEDFTIDISPLISSIMGLKTDVLLGPYIGGISLNTVYYFPGNSPPAAPPAPAVSAPTLLTEMANLGNGKYVEADGGESIAYQSFAPVIRNIKYNLADFWVENENVVGADDGNLALDSDGDGIPDSVEIALGSNPFNADSDGNGVSDLVEYRTKGAPCNDAHCAPSGRDAYSICDGFSPTTDSNGNVHFPSSSNDGLNDCEKFVLGATRTEFDSNADFIPDLLAFKNSIPFISGTTGAFLSPFGDGMTDYQKLKLGYPTTVSASHLLAFEPRVNALTHVASTTADNECYHLTSKHVAVLQFGNTIKLSMIENNALIDNKTVLKTAQKQWNGNDKIIYFSDGDFQ